MIPRLFVIASMLLIPAQFLAQQGAGIPKDSSSAATQELEAIISEAEKLEDKNAGVNIQSRAAMLVSFSEPGRSESMFLAIWKFASAQPRKDFDKEQARTLILKYLFSRNPKLARQLLAELPKPEDSSLQSRAMGSSGELRLKTKVALELMDTDPSTAAGLLEKSLSVAATPAGLGALSRLREKDPLLSDYVAAKVMDVLATQPTIVSLPGLHLLGAYMFPGAEAPIFSTDAETSLQLLQYRYFLAGSEVLRASLQETPEALTKDQHYSELDLQFRASYQAQVAAILAALAPRFQPSLAVELTDIARKLAPNVPASMPQLSQFTLSRIRGNQPTSDDPEMNFLLAISKADFDEASKLLDRLKESEKKDVYTQLLNKTQARALLAQSDVMGALTAIRKLEDQTTRLVMYLDAMKVAKKKHDSDLTNMVVDEARLLIPQTDRNGLHLRALLSFTAQLMNANRKDDAFEFLGNAVVTINALGKRTNEKSAETLAEAAMVQLNDPNSLLDAPEMDQAFSVVGLIDLDRGLALANRIEPKPVQLVARLETIQGIIKRSPPKPKLRAKPTNVLSNSKQ